MTKLTILALDYDDRHARAAALSIPLPDTMMEAEYTIEGLNGVVHDTGASGGVRAFMLKVAKHNVPAGAVDEMIRTMKQDEPDLVMRLRAKELKLVAKDRVLTLTPYAVYMRTAVVLKDSKQDTRAWLVLLDTPKKDSHVILETLLELLQPTHVRSVKPYLLLQAVTRRIGQEPLGKMELHDDLDRPRLLTSTTSQWTGRQSGIKLDVARFNHPTLDYDRIAGSVDDTNVACTKLSLLEIDGMFDVVAAESNEGVVLTYASGGLCREHAEEQDVDELTETFKPQFFGGNDAEANLYVWQHILQSVCPTLYDVTTAIARKERHDEQE